MPVNEALATYSDYAFRTAVVIYLVAMLLHLGEYARVKAPKRLVAVGAGDVLDGPDQAPEASGERSRTDRFGRMAVAMTILGALLHAGSLVTRGLAVMRWPWGNMYEYSSAVTLFAVLAWLVVLRRNPGMRRVGAFLLLPVVILLFLGGTALYAQAAPVVPALRSYWLAIHVSAISLSMGMLTMAGVASALFLVRRSGRTGGFVSMLPAADALDRVAYRVTVIAFPLYTFAIMAGAIWAEAAWGRFWGWDPKETVAFVAWVIYAGYLHARSTAGWRTGRAAWINVAGLVAVLFNLFFVNLVTAGLHSYAGVG